MSLMSIEEINESLTIKAINEQKSIALSNKEEIIEELKDKRYSYNKYLKEDNDEEVIKLGEDISDLLHELRVEEEIIKKCKAVLESRSNFSKKLKRTKNYDPRRGEFIQVIKMVLSSIIEPDKVEEKIDEAWEIYRKRLISRGSILEIN